MAGLGEMLASAVVDKVCEKLVDLLAEELTLLWNFGEDMESLKSTLLTIQAVLSDAEKRSLRKEAETERLWLKKLKSAAYEIDDMLSDFEASIPPKVARRRDKVKSFFSSSNSLISRLALAHNMKDLRKRLDIIVSERRDFDFKVDIGSNKLSGVLEIKNRETFSEIFSNDKNKIVGRDEEKEKIINILLQRDVGEDISTILIIGLGGLGKTTLAQVIFNDESIEKEFDIRVWIYVSMNFDLLNIGKTILSQIDSRGQHDGSLQYITTRLKSSLASKQFLIVLDDLWEEDGQNLEKLILMLSGGKYGSKVIVTTRSPRVAQLMSSPNVVIHSLEGLSDEDCWSIFSQRAFVYRDDVDSSLVDIGREIIKKCKGVPLAAVTLGYILRSKKDIIAWSAVRDSEFWELNDDGVLPSLKLSYYQMAAPLKLCFAYCAIFSKGSDINKDKLIQQWIALEFIQDTNGNFTPEKTGEKYVSNLLGMSFLQYSPNYEGSHNFVRMHDLVHDMARSVVGNEMLVLDARKEINGNKNHVSGCSYYSLVANYDNVGKSPDLTFLPDKVRALHFNNCTPMLLPTKVFKHKRSLRVLNFNTCQVDNLPDSIYHLKQLRYLEASLVKAKSLPESFGNLLNMITIDLSKSSLEELPNSINKLLKLKNLSLNGCSLLRALPESFSELELLIHLDLSGCSSLKVLPELFGKLSSIQFLYLSGCSKLMRLPESIGNIEGLTHLNLSDCRSLRKLPESFSELELLIHLDLSGCSSLKVLPELFGKLSSIQFLYLSGCSKLMRLPESIGNIEGLTHLNLSDCRSLRKLPESFSELELLIHLDLSGCSSLKVLPELFGKLSSIQFLYLSGCSKLMRLPESIGNIEGLTHLNLSDCRSLRKLPESFENFCKLKSLDLSGVCDLQNLPQSFSNLESLEYLNLSLCNKLDRLPERFGKLKNLKFLNLSSCTLRSLPKSFGSLLNLEKLDLSYCCNLEELPESILNSDKLQMLDLRGSNLIKFVSNIENLVRSQEGFVLLCDDMFECKEIELGGKNFSTIVRLEHLNQIRGKLHITHVEIVHNSEEAERAKLCNKYKLGSLTLQWSSSTCESLEDAKKDELVLEKLQPHKNLESLTLSGYRGTRLPSWVMRLESSMPNLTQITLCNLPYCEQLPSFERLTNLKSFEIQDAPKIKIIQTKIQSLGRLRMLSIMDMPDLEEWSLVGSTNDMKSKLESKMQNHSGLQFLSLSGCSLLQRLPESIGNIEGLTHLKLSDCRNLRELPESFGNFHKLETLDLSGCNKLDRLPECFGNLKDLKSLNLSSCTTLRKIPESFVSLHNLENLDLSYCFLEEFPESILNSDKLQEINLSCSNLVYFSANTETFVNPQAGPILLWNDLIFECKEISQGGKHCSSIGRLEHLDQIQGTLHITHVETIHSSEDAEKAKLCNKSKISSLTLQWSGSTCESLEDARREELVLEKLQPHHNLNKVLTLDGYRGLRLPSWVMGLESSLLNLTQITMCNLPHCEQLELFEHLINLEILEIHNAPNVRKIQLKMLLFKKLRMLSIRDMPNLEELFVAGLIIDMNAKLESLEINRCPRVIIKPSLPSTETSVIVESSMALSWAGVASMFPKPRISKMNIENCNVTSDEWGGLAGHVNIKDLEIKSCKNIYFFPKCILGLTSLESLTIKDCNSLADLPEWLGNLVFLRSLSIILCRKLKSLPSSIYGLTTLKNLYIRGCSFVLFGHHIHDVIISNSILVFSGRSEETYDKMEILEELGRGIFGPTKKAKLSMGQIVAVKFLRNMDANVWKFWDKIIPLGGMNHPHVMSLQAYQIGRDKDMLVYDFMPMGSLSSWLHDTRYILLLHWSTRSRIILDVALGLEYIHSISPRCAHGNITASNVLVFCNNKYSSKELPERATISNYGLGHLVGGPTTSGYKAPELISFNQAAQKSDVYSFGVLLLEMLTGRNPEHDDGEFRYLPGWVEKNIHGQLFYADRSRNNLLEAQEMKQILQLAMECVSSEPESRPTMRRVARRIEDICKLMKIMQARTENIESSIHQDENPLFRLTDPIFLDLLDGIGM